MAQDAEIEPTYIPQWLDCQKGPGSTMEVAYSAGATGIVADAWDSGAEVRLVTLGSAC